MQNLDNEIEAKAKMLPKESLNCIKKNNQLKHLQRRSIEEVGRCNKILGDKIHKQFVNVAKDQLQIIDRLILSWGDFLAKVTE